MLIIVKRNCVSSRYRSQTNAIHARSSDGCPATTPSITPRIERVSHLIILMIHEATFLGDHGRLMQRETSHYGSSPILKRGPTSPPALLLLIARIIRSISLLLSPILPSSTSTSSVIVSRTAMTP